MLGCAADGATLLLNAPQPPDEVWDALPGPVQQQVIDKRLRLYAVDAAAVAREAGLPGRTNTVLQTCFFAISGVLPADEAVQRVKAAIRKTYGRRGSEVVRRNEAAVDATSPRCTRYRCRGGPHAGARAAPTRARATPPSSCAP